MSYKFFQNKDCEWFGKCHSTQDLNNFNCLFCYCPLSPFKDCGGNYTILDNGWKDCTKCLIPHNDYDYVVSKLIELQNKQIQKEKNSNNEN